MNRILFVLVFAFIGIAGCKKGKIVGPTPPPPGCKLESYTWNSYQHILIYDGQGRVIKDSILPGGSSSTISYSGSTVNIDGSKQYTITLNTAGFPVTVNNTSSSEATTFKASYGSNGSLAKIERIRLVASPYSHWDTSTLTNIQYNTDGNISSAVVTSSYESYTITYEYESGKPYQENADPLAKILAISDGRGLMSGFGQGITPQPFCKNLLKSLSYTDSSADVETTFTYTFDTDGNVATMITNSAYTQTGSSTSNYSFHYTMTYDCH